MQRTELAVLSYVVVLCWSMLGCKSSQIAQIEQSGDSTNGYLISLSPNYFQKGSLVQITAHIAQDTPVFLFGGSAGSIQSTYFGGGLDESDYVVQPPAGVSSGLLTARSHRGMLGNSIIYSVDVPKSNLSFTRCDITLEGAVVTHLTYTSLLSDSSVILDTASYTVSTSRLPDNGSPLGNDGDTVIICYSLTDGLCPYSAYGNCRSSMKRTVSVIVDTLTNTLVSLDFSEHYSELAGLPRYSSQVHLSARQLSYARNLDGSITAKVNGNGTIRNLTEFFLQERGDGGQAGRTPVTELNNLSEVLPGGSLTVTLRP